MYPNISWWEELFGTSGHSSLSMTLEVRGRRRMRQRSVCVSASFFSLLSPVVQVSLSSSSSGGPAQSYWFYICNSVLRRGWRPAEMQDKIPVCSNPTLHWRLFAIHVLWALLWGKLWLCFNRCHALISFPVCGMRSCSEWVTYSMFHLLGDLAINWGNSRMIVVLMVVSRWWDCLN